MGRSDRCWMSRISGAAIVLFQGDSSTSRLLSIGPVLATDQKPPSPHSGWMPSLSAALDYTRDKRPAILSVRSSFKRQTVELGPHGEILPKADIFDEVVPAIEEAGLDCEVVGGGRIQHEASKRKIVIFGYSQGYGQADHRLAAQIISKKYPSYDNISWNNEGY